MTLQDLYSEIGGSYNDVMKRLGTEKMVNKFVIKFLAAADHDNLKTAVRDGDWELAFRSAHNLKGVGLNLSFDRMAEAASVLCEEIRHGAPQHDISGMIADVDKKYIQVVEQINLYKEANGL